MYNASAATLNLVRAFVTGGFADLRTVHTWNSDFVRNSRVERKYEALADEIERALAFMIASGVDDNALRTVDFYASHEALLMEYEHALTRIDSRTNTPYSVSGHMIWIGERTRHVDGAHIEFLRHLRNPLGVKLGPAITPAEAVELAERLDPDLEPGRLTFITRMGADRIRDLLPPVVQAVEATGRRVAGLGPMHGNTFSTGHGIKTRAFDQIRRRSTGSSTFTIWAPGPGRPHRTDRHRRDRVRRRVDELAEQDLNTATTACDPRLNRNQSIELAFTGREVRDAGSGGATTPSRSSRHKTSDDRSAQCTLTRPSADMRAAMMAAPVGDDVRRPDRPRVEERVASMLGHEAGCSWPPVRWATNLVAAHARPGTEVLCDSGPTRPPRWGRTGRSTA